MPRHKLDPLYRVAVVAILLVAAALRLIDLGNRPFHGDEATGAIRFAQLWQQYRGQSYHYDPYEYHGPSLPYLTLPFVELGTAENFAETSEVSYRIVTVAFGLALVVMTIGLSSAIGRPAVMIAMLFCAISPAMVFYSRYYIHEMLLVVFGFGAILSGWKYALGQQSRGSRPGWAMACGAFVGLMHATKETFAIACFAMFAALGWELYQASGNRRMPVARLLKHAGLAAAVAVIVSIAFYSSFFSDWQGVKDSVATFQHYFARAGGAGSADDHAKPSQWYISILMYHRHKLEPIFTEVVIMALGIFGAIASLTAPKSQMRHGSMARFLTVYTMVMTLMYSAIPYKTPWCLLGFWHGWILMAGVGTVALWQSLPSRAARVVVASVLIAAASHLGYQAHRASLSLSTSLSNPYAYSQPTYDVQWVEHLARDVAEIHPQETQMVIYVLDDETYWPLPFYLRAFPNQRYVKHVPDQPDAAMIIVNPRLREELDRRKQDDYVETNFNLLPDVERVVYVRESLWKAQQRHAQDPAR